VPERSSPRSTARGTTCRPHHGEIVDLGIALVPEGRRLFPKLTVEENLLLGAFRPTARAEMGRNLDFCYGMFDR
jgi:branched-chain amino acid transport system ATP-binding protein